MAISMYGTQEDDLGPGGLLVLRQRVAPLAEMSSGSLCEHFWFAVRYWGQSKTKVVCFLKFFKLKKTKCLYFHNQRLNRGGISIFAVNQTIVQKVTVE